MARAICTGCGTPFPPLAPSHRLCRGCWLEGRSNPSGAVLEREASRLIREAAARDAGGGVRVEYRAVQDALRVLGQRLPPQHASKLRLRVLDSFQDAVNSRRASGGILVPANVALRTVKVLAGRSAPRATAVMRRKLIDDLRRALEARP